MKKFIAIALMVIWTIVNITSLSAAGYAWRRVMELKHQESACTTPRGSLAI